ncbi:hypothetical protein D5I55_08760 [Chakrabartia godavariana]|nr:hypothetical protein D5I55_08760 [Chakrabartia godavariana]
MRRDCRDLPRFARLSPLPLAGGAGGGRVHALQNRPSPDPSRRREGKGIWLTRLLPWWCHLRPTSCPTGQPAWRW